MAVKTRTPINVSKFALKPVDEDSPEWTEQSLCRRLGVPPDDFFPEGNFKKNSKPYTDHIARLRAICAACSVVAQCDAYAEENMERLGFWAGLTSSERCRRRYGLDVRKGA